MPNRVQIEGIDKLMHAINRVMAAETRARPLESLRQRLIKRLSTYPPPTGDYVRTGELGRAWASPGAVQVDASGTNQFADRVSVELRNRTPYAGWVQGPDTQAFMHRGRWETTRQAIDAEAPQMVADLGNEIEAAWGRGE